MGFLSKIKQNRFWSWNKYTNELTLKVPLSLFVIAGAGIVVFAIAASIVGGIINLF